MSDGFEPKSPSQIRREWESAGDPLEFVRRQVADFFDPLHQSELPDTDRLVEDSIDRLADLSDDQFAPGELVSFELSFEGTSKRSTALFRSVPGPTELLLLCAERAEPGDMVVVRHVYAHGDMVEMSAPWPYSMDIAVTFTSPRADELEEQFADDDENLGEDPDEDLGEDLDEGGPTRLRRPFRPTIFDQDEFRPARTLPRLSRWPVSTRTSFALGLLAAGSALTLGSLFIRRRR